MFLKTPLPNPKLPYIRSFVSSPLPSQVAFHDRTYTEWMGLCSEWDHSLDVPGSSQVKEAAAMIRAAFYASQRARWLARCYFRHLRMRIARHRSSREEDDMVTCAPIPSISLVSVYDFRNRSHYTFHSQTILTTIINSLQYSQYGIAYPAKPKNPYTNLAWNVGQLTSIVGQCAIAAMQTRHRLLPFILIAFRNAQYSVPRFQRINRDSIGIDAALRFFSQHDDREMQHSYSDIVDDLYEEIMGIRPILAGSHAAKRLIKARRLPVNLQYKWDRAVIAIWIYDNLSLMYNGYRSYQDIIEDVIIIHTQTLIYTQRLAAAAIAAAAAPLPDLPAIAAIADLPVIAAIAARPILLIAEPVAINSLAPV